MPHLKLNQPIDSARAASSLQPLLPAPSMLSQIRIDFGPQDVLGRFFLLADYALQESGVTLSLGTFDDLLETNRINCETWRPLVSTFDPSSGLADPQNSFALLGRDVKGNIVTAQGARIFDWRATCFRREAEELRLFYQQPRTMALSGETCVVAAAEGGQLNGVVSFSGGAWAHPSMRGQLLGSVLSRVSRAYAYTRWRTDLSMAVMSKGLIAKGFAQQNGYPHADPGFVLKNFNVGDYDGGVVWITSHEIVEDLYTFTHDLEAKLDGFACLRRA
jgi:hypothetical protein